MRVNELSKDWSDLSAYLDGELADREKVKLENRLQSETDLQAELNQLKITKAMIRSLPHRKIPRSFALTPEMVKVEKRKTLIPVFSYASMASGLIAVVLLLVQFLPGALVMKSAVSSDQAVAEMAFEAEEIASQTKSPEIIYWGGYPTMVVVEGKGGGGPVDNIVIYEAPAAEMEEAMPADALLGEGAVPEEGIVSSQPMTSSKEESETTVEREANITDESVTEGEAPAAEQDLSQDTNGEINPILGIRPDEGNTMTYDSSLMEQTTTEDSTAQDLNFNQIAFILLGVAVISGACAIYFRRRFG